jgi:hypothetical protein
MSTLEIVLIVVLVIFAINLLIVGTYLFLVLKELHQTVKRANTVLDNIQGVTNLITSPLSAVAGIVSGVIGSLGAVKSTGSIFNHHPKGGR